MSVAEVAATALDGTILRFFVHNSDELGSYAVKFFAVQPGGGLGDLSNVVVIATQVGERRPLLLGPSGFGVTADVADEVDPHGARGSRFIGARLGQPGRRI